MKTSYKFEKGILKLKLIPDKNDGTDYSGKIRMGRHECNIHMPKDWKLENLHPDVLALTIILIAYPFIDKEIVVPLGVSQSFHDLFKQETNKSVYPIDKNLQPRSAPKNAVPGLAYSGGIDSTAALALLPENTVCFFLERILPPDAEKNLKLYNKKSIYGLYEKLEKQGRRGYMIKTDLEYVRVPRGYPVELSTTIPALLLSDYVGIDSIATGTIMEHQFLPYHQLYINRDYFVNWQSLFKYVDLSVNQVTSGISEVGSMKIVLNSPYKSFNLWCMKGENASPCLKCEKCFRKTLLEMTLLKKDIPNHLLDNFFIATEVRTMLKQMPFNCENVIAYITSHYNGDHELMNLLKKRTRGDVLNVAWMEKWYLPSKDLMAEKYFDYVKNQITKHLEIMDDNDIANMNKSNVFIISKSPLYHEYHKEFLSHLVKFKEDYIKKKEG